MMGGSMMGWVWIWPVLVLIGLALLGYVAFRLTQNRATSATTSPGDAAIGAGTSARRILDERYARGEIDEAEYHRRREGLT